MTKQSWVPGWKILVSLCAAGGITLAGCGGSPELGNGGSTTTTGGTVVPDAGASDSSGGIITPDVGPRPDARRPPADANCDAKVSCQTDAGTYCGQIGDGCGGTLDCGDCTGGQVCVQNVCTTPVDGCAPLT